jgi:ferrous iron transport protein B
MRELTIALVGNPNCGKSTLFNALTGSHQHIGNWPGVTVERKSGYYFDQDQRVEVIDLPGTYSLTTLASEQALDTQISCEYLLNDRPDLVINVVDAAHLDRHLYLTLQLLESKVPVIIALNMMDVADKQGIAIDVAKLSEQLGCPVLPLQSRNKKGLVQLKHAILNYLPATSGLDLYPDAIHQAIARIAPCLAGNDVTLSTQHFALRLLENDQLALQTLDKAQLALVNTEQAHLTKELGEDIDMVFADLRYSFIQQLLLTMRVQPAKGIHTYTAWLDKIVLNRWLAIPIFLGVMYTLFFFSLNVGGALQDFFDMASDTLFVQGTSHLLASWHCPPWLIAIIAGGAGKGLNTTITFIPVLAALFLFLSLLEASGYMARAAFVMDRCMRTLGLPGKSFVPMIIGFGCNVPGIMATRTLENKRDRILTVLMIPFMSCSARMAIFAIFTAAFFPVQGHNIVFSLYLLGIMVAIFTGVILRKSLLPDKVAPLILELPPYHLPSLQAILRQTWQRLQGFVLRAGILIVPFCIVLGTLNAINTDGSLSLIEGNPHSLLAAFGQWLTPIFSPMGIQAENWPATVGILAGVLAKEVVIGSLNT